MNIMNTIVPLITAATVALTGCSTSSVQPADPVGVSYFPEDGLAYGESLPTMLIDPNDPMFYKQSEGPCSDGRANENASC